jgi:hypothetical protein
LHQFILRAHAENFLFLSLSLVFATTHIYLLAGEPLNLLKSASFVIALAALFFFCVRQQDQFRNASCISTSSSSSLNLCETDTFAERALCFVCRETMRADAPFPLLSIDTPTPNLEAF